MLQTQAMLMHFKMSLLILALLFSAGLTGCEPKSRPTSSDDDQSLGNQALGDQSPDQRGKANQETDRESDEREPKELEPRGVVQEAELRDLPGGVVDGDTFKAVGFSESLRLLSIDTEELVHRKVDRARVVDDWDGYLAEQTEGDGYKTFGTPLGDEAKAYARDFFEGVDKIWVEYQSSIRTHGFFGRHLAYVWIKDDGQWVNYNLEAVRDGMSAYYTKYGRSERYHDHFVAAQREARENERGIWAPGAKSYPDYDGRIAWWNRRAEPIALFKDHFDDNPDFVDLGTDTALSTLRNRLGRRMVVFGEPTSFAERGRPQRIRLNYRYRRDFPVVAFEPHDMTKSGVNPDKEEFIYVEGVVGMYRGDPQLRYDEKSWMRAGTNPPVEKVK
jgi:endonuclease YncB( thermonuclease family)